MTEIAVQFASRYIKRKQSDAVGKNLLKTLTEPITNSDDSYGEIIKFEPGNDNIAFPIFIFIDRKKRLIRITDNAQGMTRDDLEAKFKEYGAAKSSAYKGGNSRGIFGQGISDVLFYHQNGTIKTIKNDEASVCNFYWKKDRQYISVDKQRGKVSEVAKEWGINNNRGTVVEFVVDNNTIHDYENLVKKLKVFYMLRMINANDKRRVKLVYKDTKGTKESVIKYQFPEGELVTHKDFTFEFENYSPVKVDIILKKSAIPLPTIGDERENGLLVYDEKEAIYDQTFFGLDDLPGADKFFGFMKLTGAREIILSKINDPKHPESILTDSRDGFDKQRDFYKQLALKVKDLLWPILSEERSKKTNEGVSASTIEKHRKAFEELNKLYAQLTGEDVNGIIRTKKKSRQVGGIEFARNNITITAGKRYGLQLLVDTRVIKPGSKIFLKSSKGVIGVSPAEVEVGEAQVDNDDILGKTIIVTGTKAGTADTLEASSDERNATVVIEVISAEVIYPEKGIIFSPDYIRATANQDAALHLYVDLNVIKPGSKVVFSSSNESIKLKKSRLVVPRSMRNKTKVAKIEVPFVGQKNNESGIIEAILGEYSAQCRIDIRDKVKTPPMGPTGKFKDWNFDDRLQKQQQTFYDDDHSSPTQGYILINSNHPINKYYFGDNPQKKDVEKSNKAQLYLAELILNESLGAMIPEAYQKGVIARNYGPEYDIPVYIAQKKFELGPTIYNFFVEEQSIREVKREKQLEEVKQGKVLTDKEFVDGLPDREKHMLEMRFGLNDERPHTLEEIAKKFSPITRERVRQIIEHALEKKYGYKKPIRSAGEKSAEKERDLIKEEEDNLLSLQDKIVTVVARFYGIDVSEIKRRTRQAHIVIPRQIAVYLLRDMVGLSFPSIGKIFSFDHTTAMYACDKIKNSLATDSKLNGEIQKIKASLD